MEGGILEQHPGCLLLTTAEFTWQVLPRFVVSIISGICFPRPLHRCNQTGEIIWRVFTWFGISLPRGRAKKLKKKMHLCVRERETFPKLVLLSALTGAIRYLHL